ncbi:MAG: hypothetical protein IJZ15_06745 [Oscillospiraceae bacterium]|nr:hypothetical protein [Oscillospiraceae bacterium]
MERITRVRIGIILLVFCLILGFFSFKLYDMQIIETGGKTDNTKIFVTETRVKAARGNILDRNGNVLVANRASYDLVLNHYIICSAADTNDRLLELVQMCREMNIEYIDHFPVTKELPFEYTLSDYNSTWQGYFQAYLPKKSGGLDSDITAPLLIRKLRTSYNIPEDWSDEDARAVIGIRYELDLRQGITNLPNYIFLEDASSQELYALLELNTPGLKAEASTVRDYNTKYAAHILGYIGPMTNQQWNEIYKAKPGYPLDALVGQSGLEEAFEEYLHGTDGIRVDEMTADGTLVRSYYKVVDGVEQRPVNGQNVELSIDLNVQATAEDQMAALFTELRQSGENLAEGEKKPDGSDAEGGAVVVMDVKTGQMLACASYPTYDLSTFREDYNDLLEMDFAPLYNRALQATYPPGSTYKMAMVIAGIDGGAVTRTQNIVDQGVYRKYEASGFTADCLIWSKNHATHGSINAMEALRDSCNYYFYSVGDKLDINVMDRVAKGLGLGEKTGIELAEKTGLRANPENKLALYKGNTDLGRWYAADQIMASIGQSINSFTPVQLCAYTSALANRGVRYKATFLSRVLDADYSSVVYTNEAVELGRLDISDEAYAAYTEGMRMVITEGSVKRYFKDYPIAVAAKTGTAQTDAGDAYSDNGAFVCYAPYDDPEIAVVVYGEKAGHGSTMAQIAKAVLDTYFSDVLSAGGNSGENTVS